MRIFCITCQRWYQCGGFNDVRTVGDSDGYTQRGDLYTCEGCGHQIVADFGQPYPARHDFDYQIAPR